MEIKYIFETGGGWTFTGDSRITCGLNGEPLKKIVKTDNKIHVNYLVVEEIVMIECIPNKNGYTFQGYKINCSQKGDRTLLFKVENMDEVPEKFIAAAKASLDRTKCYHCSESH